MLISLHAVKDTARDGDGDQELAATLYERIQARLTGLATHGQPVTITLDDRTSPTDDAPFADSTTPGTTDEPVTDPPTPDDNDHEDPPGLPEGSTPS